ncbi:nucleobase:cation symporter-2 family protein [Escherichia coli]|nr:nucleobase:cation symporter-2 family protein [Escherichia coli]
MSAIDSQLPSSSGQDRPTDEVDRILSPGKLIILGLQHVLVMYAGAVAVPLMIGDRLGLSKEAIAMLISSDLFCCGIVTLLQCIGIGRFMGIRLPVIMSVTFAAVTPMIAIGMNPDIGLLGIFGATIAAGFITTLLAQLIGRLMPLFPPLVTGVVITSIGLSIIQVGIDWAALMPLFPPLVTGVVITSIGLSIIQVGIDWAAGGKGNPQYGNPVYLGISFAVLIFILLITRYAKGFMSNVAVLLGIVFGFLLSWMMNEVNLSGLHDASWFAIVTPMSFGMPIFDPVSILTMTAVLIIVFIESMGMFLALGEIVGRKLSSHDIIRGLRVDGVGTMIGGTFNSFPHTSFSQNVGLVSVTRVHSRWVCISSGIILILFGMVPKMAVLVASIPQFVLGGAGLVMFGMVLATGIRILSRCNYTTNRYNLYIVAISLGVGMTPTLSHDFFSKLPAVLQPLLHSGIMLATLSAVVLNVFFNGYQHHADLVKESVSDKDLKVRTVRMWLLMRKLKKNEHGE